MRRAIHDWVLYRESEKASFRKIALDAEQWLFGEEHATKGRPTTDLFMSLVSMCLALDLKVSDVRERARNMTPRDILCTGRPAERRHACVDEDVLDSSSDFGVHASLMSIGETNEPLCMADSPWVGARSEQPEF